MAFNIGGCQCGSRAFASTLGPLTMAWAWPRQGLPVQGLFNGKWYDGQIRRCHYKEKDRLQTAEVYEVEVQWDGECSQSTLPVEHVRLPDKHVRLRPSPEHPPVLRPWPLPPFQPMEMWSRVQNLPHLLAPLLGSLPTDQLRTTVGLVVEELRRREASSPGWS